MKVGIRIDGEKELSKFLRKFSKQVVETLDDEVEEISYLLRSKIVKRYHAHESSGAVYTHEIVGQLPNGYLVQGKERSKPHIASAPGSPPNSDTGLLASSVAVHRLGVAKQEVAPYGVAQKYGAWLEWGTKKVLPRPLWRPERDKMQPLFVKSIEGVIAKRVRNANR